MNCNYKVKITDIQTKYKFKVFCTGYDDSEIKEKIDAMYEAWPKATAEGETPTLDNTANATMSIDLKGNTSQYTTTGINILKPIDTQTQSSNGITRTTNADGSITFTGTATANSYLRISDYLTLESNTSYTTLNQNAILPSGVTIYYNNLANIGVEYNDTVISPAGRLKAFTTGTVTGIISIAVLIQNGTTVNVTLYPMLVKGTITSSNIPDYEPYTNGASPNPDYPQDVHVVTGDNTINICGKNLISNIDIFNGYPTGNNGGTIGYNTSVNSITYKKCCYVIAGQEYTLSWKINTVKAVGNRDIKIVDNNNIILENFSYSNANNNRTRTFTPTKSGWIYVALDTNATEVQIEKGPIASEYVGLLGTTYPINLGSLELCKIGDYQDYIYKDNKKWYKYGAIGKVVLNGSESGWHTSSLSVTGYKSYYVDSSIRINQDATGSKCNYFEYKTFNEWQSLLQATFIENSYQAIGIRVVETLAPTLEDFKTWLSTHNTIAYFVLATPTTTEITDATLISQLNALAEAESYSGQTNISQTNDDKPFIITAKALKDLSNL